MDVSPEDYERRRAYDTSPTNMDRVIRLATSVYRTVLAEGFKKDLRANIRQQVRPARLLGLIPEVVESRESLHGWYLGHRPSEGRRHIEQAQWVATERGYVVYLDDGGAVVTADYLLAACGQHEDLDLPRASEFNTFGTQPVGYSDLDHRPARYYADRKASGVEVLRPNRGRSTFPAYSRKGEGIVRALRRLERRARERPQH